MFNSLKGKTVIVTGGSKGIGKGIALRFGQVGCNLVVVSRNLEEAQATAALVAEQGTQAIGVAADVRRRSDMDAVAQQAMAAFGRIDILCANAGIFPSAALADMTEEDYDLVMDTNVKGMFMAVTACLPYMKQQMQGRIILTSSITGPITGFPGWSHYGASKAAQLGFMRTAAIELAPWKITVNAVSPGNIMTEGLDGMGDEYIRQMAASVPLGYLGEPVDIANGALFFATDEARYMTGQNLVIDGGQILPESLSALEAMQG
ncbi:3-oxoacyl-ACP reductase FabG [Pseudaeromonas sp. ZJS20]|uniref:3-oxoacyl-ACP reductase FabG n=1 Tax=Pseudaeromonas aegiceratis TaxID=3153928 RepID=UPI00390C4E55